MVESKHNKTRSNRFSVLTKARRSEDRLDRRVPFSCRHSCHDDTTELIDGLGLAGSQGGGREGRGVSH